MIFQQHLQFITLNVGIHNSQRKKKYDEEKSNINIIIIMFRLFYYCNFFFSICIAWSVEEKNVKHVLSLWIMYSCFMRKKRRKKSLMAHTVQFDEKKGIFYDDKVLIDSHTLGCKFCEISCWVQRYWDQFENFGSSH